MYESSTVITVSSVPELLAVVLLRMLRYAIFSSSPQGCFRNPISVRALVRINRSDPRIARAFALQRNCLSQRPRAPEGPRHQQVGHSPVVRHEISSAGPPAAGLESQPLSSSGKAGALRPAAPACACVCFPMH